MAEFLRHEPCEVCGSSDAKAIYDDGNTFCFSCQTLTTADQTHNMPTNVQFKVQPKGCKNEKLAKKPVNTTKYRETENFYASLITTVVNNYKDSKQKPN